MEMSTIEEPCYLTLYLECVHVMGVFFLSNGKQTNQFTLSKKYSILFVPRFVDFMAKVQKYVMRK